jgi:4'-phosphopantetheinyl transferase EntD
VDPDVAFHLELEHGICVGVRLPGEPASVDALATRALLEDERAFAATLSSVRRATWIGGRVALRAALARASFAAGPVLPDERGAPRLPPGVAGSISHKERLAVALVAAEASARVGVDIEIEGPRVHDIASKVLDDDEMTELVATAAHDRAREVLLRFSLKEAIYKALDPFVKRYVGFKEVSVSPRPDGSATVRPRLRAGEERLAIEATWRRVEAEGLVLTTARVEAGGANPQRSVRSGP